MTGVDKWGKLSFKDFTFHAICENWKNVQARFTEIFIKTHNYSTFHYFSEMQEKLFSEKCSFFSFIFVHFSWNRSFSFSTISIVWTVFKCILHTIELHSIKVKIHVAWRNYEGRKSHKENSFSSWILLNQSTRIPTKGVVGNGRREVFFRPCNFIL